MTRTTILAVLIALALPALPASAASGTYTVWSCRGPAGEPVPAYQWQQSTSGGVVHFDDTCASGGGLSVSIQNSDFNPSGASGAYTLQAPPETSIVGYRMWRYLFAAPGQSADFVAQTVENPFSLGQSADACSSFGSCSSAGTPTTPLDPSNLITQRSKGDVFALLLNASCAKSTYSCGPSSPPSGDRARVTLFRAAIDIRSTAPPGASLSGSVANGATVSGLATAQVDASAPAGGVASVSLRIDGGPALAQASGGPCRQPYTALIPCPVLTSQGFVIDTRALSNGRHTLTGSVTDASGMSASLAPDTFTVRNSSTTTPRPTIVLGPLVPANGIPAVLRPRLSLRPLSLRARRGAHVTVGGTLRTTTGTPVRNARLLLRSTTLGRGTGRIRTLRTDRRGRFATRVKTGGQQSFTVSFAPARFAAVTATARRVLRTRLGLTMSATPRRLRRGHTVHLSGRLSGAGPAAGGTLVEIQAIVHHHWSTIAAVDAGRNGRFHWNHRFLRITQPTLFTFRARVPRTARWPWASAASGAHTVLVRVGR